MHSCASLLSHYHYAEPVYSFGVCTTMLNFLSCDQRLYRSSCPVFIGHAFARLAEEALPQRAHPLWVARECRSRSPGRMLDAR